MPGGIRAAGRRGAHDLVWVPGPVVVQSEPLLRGRGAIRRPRRGQTLWGPRGPVRAAARITLMPDSRLPSSCDDGDYQRRVADDSRSDSVRPGRMPEGLLGRVCMLCHISGRDEKSVPEPLGRHEPRQQYRERTCKIIMVFGTYYQSAPEATRDPEVYV